MPPITEAKLYEAFGLTPPEETGAQAQEPAAPAAEETTVEPAEGAQGQEVAAPAAEPTQPETDPEAEPAQQVAGKVKQEPSGQPLSEEQRRANAARRRQQEQQQAIEAALQTERQKNTEAMNQVFARAGMKNTFTGEPITNFQQFQEWNRKFEETRLQRELQTGKLTAEGLQQAIGQHPAIQQAQQLIQQEQTRQQEQQRAAEKARIENELAEIAKIDPTIHGVADILKMPTASQFREFVGKGYGFLDAFRLSNMDSIANAKVEAAKQEAMNNARGKDHLRATGNARGTGAASVPPQQMAIFRQMNPKASDADIQKFYNQYLSRKGG